MRLVLDTNILIAALIKDSVTREILTHPEMEFLVSEFIFEEVAEYRDEIHRKSGLTHDSFELLFEALKQQMIFLPHEEIRHKARADEIMKDIDLKDSLFIAIALSTTNDGIWSEDKDFEKQDAIRVWKTKDLIKYLRITHDHDHPRG